MSTTVKYVKSRLKNNQASAGVAPVIKNITAPANTNCSFVFPFRILELPHNRTAATWFSLKGVSGSQLSVVQTLQFASTSDVEFHLNRYGSVNINGSKLDSSNKLKRNTWYIAEVYGQISEELEEIVLGAPINNLNMVSADFGEGMTFFLNNPQRDVVESKVTELMSKYGIQANI